MSHLIITEHLVEVQIVKRALESTGGACDQLQAATDVEMQKHIRQNIDLVLKILNGPDNLFYVEKKLENMVGCHRKHELLTDHNLTERYYCFQTSEQRSVWQ